MKIPEIKCITVTEPTIRLEDLNHSTISHIECFTRMIRNIREDTKIEYYNTTPKCAKRFIVRGEIDIFGDFKRITSKISTLHIFNDDGSETMIRI